MDELSDNLNKKIENIKRIRMKNVINEMKKHTTGNQHHIGKCKRTDQKFRIQSNENHNNRKKKEKKEMRIG